MIRAGVSWICLVALLARGGEPLEVPRAARAPEIDGNLEPEVWKTAAVIPELVPARGAADPAPPTSVRVLWNENALYVAFECRDDRVWSSPEFDRDGDLYDRDVVEVFLHAGGAPVPYYELVVSPRNQVLDAAHFLTAPPEYNENGILPDPFLKKHFWTFRSWTWEGLETATNLREDGERWIWTVEMKLPVFKLLRQQARTVFRSGDVLRANFLRYDWEGAALRQANWQPVLTGCPHISPGAMGRLRLVEAATPVPSP